ncbi:MAG: hypothetical protein ACRD2O_02680 [Terriglobia bacterium]
MNSTRKSFGLSIPILLTTRRVYAYYWQPKVVNAQDDMRGPRVQGGSTFSGLWLWRKGLSIEDFRIRIPAVRHSHRLLRGPEN